MSTCNQPVGFRITRILTNNYVCPKTSRALVERKWVLLDRSFWIQTSLVCTAPAVRILKHRTINGKDVSPKTTHWRCALKMDAVLTTFYNNDTPFLLKINGISGQVGTWNGVQEWARHFIRHIWYGKHLQIATSTSCIKVEPPKTISDHKINTMYHMHTFGST